MNWSDAVPNLLIGLREGLEAGLVVTILLAAVRKRAEASGDRVSTAPIWFGVLGAIAVAGSFAAVLSYSTDVLSSSGQEAVGGILSVLAVALVTAMIFWMRRTAASLAGELRGRVDTAMRIGTGALAVTAFLAVGREGLETTLFLWTAAKAAGDTVAPIVGAAIGLALAVLLCWLLFRRAIRINLGVFFNRTALALIVIAAGVLSYGLGDLQDAGLLAGRQWVAFDLSGHVDAGSWWATLITGVTDLSVRMTVLQVVAWAVYLVAVITAFLRAGARSSAPGRPPAAKSTTTAAAASMAPEPARDSAVLRRLSQRPAVTAIAMVAVPVAVAALVIAVLPSSSSASVTAVSVTDSACAPEFSAIHTGNQTINVQNKTDKAGEINLDNASGGVVAEIETIGPATTAAMTATIGPGVYTIRCIMSGGSTTASDSVQASGSARDTSVPAAVKPVTVAELTGPNNAYRAYAARDLVTLTSDVARLRADFVRGDLTAARADWLTAQLTWERVGASYDSFGDDGLAIDGLPDGLQGGVDSPQFTGLHRVEYGLWHGQNAAELLPVVTKLGTAVTLLRKHLGSEAVAGDPTQLPLRVHEILEDALRDHLSGIDDQGAGAAYAMTYADTQVTQVVLNDVAAPLDARAPHLRAKILIQLHALQRVLLAARVDGHWRSLADTPLLARQRVNAAIGEVLQTLSAEPNLLEVPPTH